MIAGPTPPILTAIPPVAATGAAPGCPRVTAAAPQSPTRVTQTSGKTPVTASATAVATVAGGPMLAVATAVTPWLVLGTPTAAPKSP